MSLLTQKSYRNSEALWLGFSFAAFLLVLLVDRGRTFNYAGQPIFWDAHVYVRAIHALQAGNNPYARASNLSFVYPPIALHAASALSRLLHGALAWKLYLLLTLFATVSIPVVIASGYLRSPWFNAGCALLVATFHPFFTSAFSFFAGNVASILYASVLLAGVPGIRRNRWSWFYVAVAVTASVKIAMLAFLLLALLLGEGQRVSSVLTGFIVLAVNIAQRVVTPAEYQAYLDAAHYQVLGRSELGFGVCSTLFRIVSRSANIPHIMLLLAHLLTCSVLVAAMFWAHRRGIPGEMRNWWVSLVLLLAVLCNPRMLAYDIALIIVPTAFLIVEAVGLHLARRRSSMLLAGFVLATIIALSRSALDAYCLLSVACFPIAGYLWLSPLTAVVKNTPVQPYAETPSNRVDTWDDGTSLPAPGLQKGT